jgi:hypothetical protein
MEPFYLFQTSFYNNVAVVEIAAVSNLDIGQFFSAFVTCC